jgi:hypothetical protein
MRCMTEWGGAAAVLDMCVVQLSQLAESASYTVSGAVPLSTSWRLRWPATHVWGKRVMGKVPSIHQSDQGSRTAQF